MEISERMILYLHSALKTRTNPIDRRIFLLEQQVAIERMNKETGQEVDLQVRKKKTMP